MENIFVMKWTFSFKSKSFRAMLRANRYQKYTAIDGFPVFNVDIKARSNLTYILLAKSIKLFSEAGDILIF